MSHLCNCICCFHLPPAHPPCSACLWPLSLCPCMCHCLPYLFHTLTCPTPTHTCMHACPQALTHHLMTHACMLACPHACPTTSHHPHAILLCQPVLRVSALHYL